MQLAKLTNRGTWWELVRKNKPHTLLRKLSSNGNQIKSLVTLISKDSERIITDLSIEAYEQHNAFKHLYYKQEISNILDRIDYKWSFVIALLLIRTNVLIREITFNHCFLFNDKSLFICILFPNLTSFSHISIPL